MKTEEQLLKVIEIATQRRDEALRALGGAQNDLRQAQAQMDQLQGYARESQHRWQQRASQGVSAMLMLHQQQFMARIDHAVEFQNGVITNMELHLSRCQAELLSVERELASLKKYAERRQRAVAQALERQEQKATDETAANQHRRQTQNPLNTWRPS